MFRIRTFARFVLLVALASGCGKTLKPGQKPTYSVRGQVLVNDQPATNARVILVPLSGTPDERRPSAFCLSDGTFELSTYESRDGAPEGEYTVLIEWRPALPENPREQGPDRLGGKYADLKTAALKVTVKKEPNALEPFRLSLPKTAGLPARSSDRG
ncbi:Uncharacterized protein OS=Blastopirellula marina DSM 3645 GN=DSM3645_13505 PE=4 SV=1 [Gemmata massiliana]|uniref:Carboxypeptidase regulatory-like domain-containing protein n=1 Tax=Gemmata massiliana TaxID=1210884 RepID=A0A6P2DJY9_9BACT|nr:hypothetical protein [Gemmata massiliana]VTS02834.1 Uncharacterized protein OS=Blastopirellula marina DSM 3645 GN=DSM3645_13505 PE=4 SV=1 [Gemmata massiliana]